MSKSTASLVPAKVRGRIVLLIIALLFMYILLPRIGDFSASWTVLKHADFEFIGVALLAVAMTYIMAGLSYVLLAVKKLAPGPAIMVQVASAFTNRLLPAGLGGLTMNVQYLRHSKHSLPQALSVAGTNNTIGFIGHGILLVVIIAWSKGQLFSRLSLPDVDNQWLILAVVLGFILANLLVFRRLRDYLYKLTAEIMGYLWAYRQRPLSIAGALLCLLVLTSCNVTALYLCLRAVGVEAHIWEVFVAFSFGMLAATATPTPGGLGGAEAGFVAGLISYGIASPEALAAVLLYRLMTFWLPLAPGLAVFLSIRNRYL